MEDGDHVQPGLARQGLWGKHELEKYAHKDWTDSGKYLVVQFHNRIMIHCFIMANLPPPPFLNQDSHFHHG